MPRSTPLKIALLVAMMLPASGCALAETMVLTAHYRHGAVTADTRSSEAIPSDSSPAVTKKTPPIDVPPAESR